MPHVTFVHGLLNKPPQDVLLAEWLAALRQGGLDLSARGVTSSMVYWADVLYARPEAEDPAQRGAAPEEDELLAVGADVVERAFVAALRRRTEELAEEAIREGGATFAAASERAVPLPHFLEKILMRRLLRDCHHYLYDAESRPRPGVTYRVRREIRQRFVAALRAVPPAAGPHVVVSHSMGTVIAYDCLRHVADTPGVAALFTIGSPLGLSEVQDGFGDAWEYDTAYPSAKLALGAWTNVYDRLDPVCGFDTVLANDYLADGEETVADVRVSNSGAWRHGIAQYLAQPAVVARLRDRLGL